MDYDLMGQQCVLNSRHTKEREMRETKPGEIGQNKYLKGTREFRRKIK
jgi:hypothetical protein